MAYDIATLKNDLAAVLHGTTLNQVQNLDGLIDRAGREFLADVDAMETKRISEITNAIYDRVYDYPLPLDVKGNRVIDIFPQVNRTVANQAAQTYNQEFDTTKTSGAFQFTILYNSSVKTIRIAKSLLRGVLMNGADSTTVNGTWTVGGTASNLTTDTLNYVQGNGSLRFDLDAGANPSAGWVETSDMTAVDLSVQATQGSQFYYQYIPDPDVVISIDLRWGSSTGDYWYGNVTTAQNNVAFQRGWNLLQFPWQGAASVGSPDATAVNYLRSTINYDGTATDNFRVDDYTSQLGAIYLIEYYSKFLFRNYLTNAFQENVTSDNDLINLDTDSYNVYFNLVAYYAAQQIQSTDGAFDAQFWRDEYEKAKKRYVAKIKSEVIKPTQTYYPMPNVQPPVFIRYSSS